MDGSLESYVRWMGLRNLSPETIRSRVSILAGLAATLGVPLALAARDDLARWEATLAIADASRARYVSVVTCFYRWLLEDERIGTDPARWLVAPKVPRRVPRPIPEDDLALALAAAAAPVRCWLLLAAYGGLRGAEIASVDRGDVYDTSDPPVVVVHGKGDRERLVPICPSLLDSLRPYLCGSGALFRREDGRPVNPAHVRRGCNGLLRELGIPSTLHKLRARFASEIYRASGRDLRLTQELLGHASPSTTAGYVAWHPAQAAAAVMNLGRRAS